MKEVYFDKYFSLHAHFRAQVLDFISFLLEKQQKEKLMSENSIPRKSHFGSAKGLIVMSDDFNAPLEDFKEYM